jgi:hypothetical protein
MIHRRPGFFSPISNLSLFPVSLLCIAGRRERGRGGSGAKSYDSKKARGLLQIIQYSILEPLYELIYKVIIDEGRLTCSWSVDATSRLGFRPDRTVDPDRRNRELFRAR